MQIEEKTILESVKKHVIAFFDNHISPKYTYHNLQHTVNVVNAVKQLSVLEGIGEEDIELLEIAAWFHDLGYDQGAEGHERRSANYAMVFLTENGFDKAYINKICNCILATKYPSSPTNLLEQLLCDADLCHLGKENYWERCSKVREELALMREIVMNEQEWIDFELAFMQNHKFHTAVAKELYDKNKRKHVKKLIKQKARLAPHSLTKAETTLITKKKNLNK